MCFQTLLSIFFFAPFYISCTCNIMGCQQFSLLPFVHLFHFQFVSLRHDRVWFAHSLGIRCVSIFSEMRSASFHPLAHSFPPNRLIHFIVFSSFAIEYYPFETLQYSYCVYRWFQANFLPPISNYFRAIFQLS